MPKLMTLTPEQTAQFPVYRERWLRIGFSCEPCDVEAAKRALPLVYASAKLPPPTLILVMDSPWSAALTGAILKEMDKKAQATTQVGAQVRAQVWAQVRAQVWDQVRDQVRAQVWAQIYGSHEAGWLSFYAFFLEVCQLACCHPLQGLVDLAKVCGWWSPLRDVAILQHRHSELHRDTAHRLHAEHGMAVRYRDGFGVYALHGVRMEPWMVDTPAEQLDATKVLAVPNAEQRRELIRKVGVERLLAHLPHRSLDRTTDGMYDLLSIRFSDHLQDARVLKMRNPSIGVWHLERVANECRTVQEAVNWRAWGDRTKRWHPEVLT